MDHPELEGKVEDFKLFASKPTRRGVDFEDLIPAFLYNESKNKVAPKKGQMFEQGTGGNSKPKPKGDKISTEEGRLLMNTDYNKFKELLKAGKSDFVKATMSDQPEAMETMYHYKSPSDMKAYQDTWNRVLAA